VTGGGSAYETPRIYGQPNYFGTGNTSATCRQVDGTSSGGCTGSKWEAGLAARWNEGGRTNAAFLFVIGDCEPQPENAIDVPLPFGSAVLESGAGCPGSDGDSGDCGGAKAEPVVSEHRQQLDVAAGWGVPAHVTVLYPFVAPEALSDTLITTLAAVVRSVRAFDVCFGRTRWFGQDALWLDPEPAQPVPRADCGGVASFSAASAVRRCLCRRHSAPDHCRAAVGRFAYPPCGRAGCAIRTAPHHAH
jgi:hypothetical protein